MSDLRENYTMPHLRDCVEIVDELYDSKLAAEAANELSAIDAQILANPKVRALVEALKPFSAAAKIRLCGEWRDEDTIQPTDVSFHVTFGDLRRADAALAALPEVKE